MEPHTNPGNPERSNGQHRQIENLERSAGIAQALLLVICSSLYGRGDEDTLCIAESLGVRLRARALAYAWEGLGFDVTVPAPYFWMGLHAQASFVETHAQEIDAEFRRKHTASPEVAKAVAALAAKGAERLAFQHKVQMFADAALALALAKEWNDDAVEEYPADWPSFEEIAIAAAQWNHSVQNPPRSKPKPLDPGTLYVGEEDLFATLGAIKGKACAHGTCVEPRDTDSIYCAVHTTRKAIAEMRQPDSVQMREWMLAQFLLDRDAEHQTFRSREAAHYLRRRTGWSISQFEVDTILYRLREQGLYYSNGEIWTRSEKPRPEGGPR